MISVLQLDIRFREVRTPVTEYTSYHLTHHPAISAEDDDDDDDENEAAYFLES